MIQELIRAQGGLLPLRSFMEHALYHSQDGYYSKNIKTVGRCGNFSTTVTLHFALGKAISRWLQAHRKDCSPRGDWHVIEIGGGDGSLAQTILDNLSWRLRRNLHYHIVEISEPLQEQQEKSLADGQVTWHRDIKEALKEAEGRAFLVSNELVDAFPCTQVVFDEGKWKEVCLGIKDNTVMELFVSDREVVHPPFLSTVFTEEHAFPNGQRCEIHESYRDWLKSWAPHWKQGLFLTVDYGDVFSKLYYRRPRGTLRGYWQHMMMEGMEIYRRIGQQDLTADVNFSDLIRWGQELGLPPLCMSSQREFILKWQPDLARQEARDLALAFILHPHGLGDAFKVLVQAPRATDADNG